MFAQYNNYFVPQIMTFKWKYCPNQEVCISFICTRINLILMYYYKNMQFRRIYFTMKN